MKKLSFLLIILSLTVVFSACPPLLEDNAVGGSSGEVITFAESFELDVYKWFEILDSIAKNGKFVTLDLSKAIFKEGNTSGGLIKDPLNLLFPIAFDPFPASSSGKDLIVSIILPETAQDIKNAKTEGELIDINDEKIEDAKKYSAFRSFTHLRSVKADNVTHIGNFAFADCKELTEVNFPRVSYTVSLADIDKYAFLGCTGLKEIKFNSATIIGECAFKDCTNLSKIDFPEVWMIDKNAFEGCKSLVNVFFEKAFDIYDEAFKGCTGLKKAEFNVTLNCPNDPSLLTPHDPSLLIPNTPSPIPNDPPLFGESDFSGIDSSSTHTSVMFHLSVFNGCKALEVLNIRNAWNVYFAKNVFANTGSAIEIYLFDVPATDPDNSFGHPQNTEFLGKDVTVTVKKVNIFTPVNEGKIQTGSSAGIGIVSSIASYIRTNYSNIDVNVNKR